MVAMQELKERFLTFETVRGTYMIPAGAWIVWMSMPERINHLIETCGYILGGYMVVEGLRKMSVNQIKLYLERDALKEKRVVRVKKEKQTAIMKGVREAKAAKAKKLTEPLGLS